METKRGRPGKPKIEALLQSRTVSRTETKSGTKYVFKIHGFFNEVAIVSIINFFMEFSDAPWGQLRRAGKENFMWVPDNKKEQPRILNSKALILFLNKIQTKFKFAIAYGTTLHVTELKTPEEV
jgi:hypothetical protein